jgi:hypothetical protein
MKHRGLPVLLLVVTAPLAAGAAGPQALVPPLRTGAGVNDADRAEFDKKLRAALGTRVEVLPADATKKATEKAGVGNVCEDAACARKLADASGARFVVLAHVANEEEIYKVTGAVFDAANDKITGTVNKSCELCAAREVGGTIDAVVAELSTALAAPAPAKAAPPPPPVAKVEKADVKVTSDPPGAKVTIDGQPAGETPLKTQLDIGGHTVVVAKDGYDSEERAITLDTAGLDVEVALKATGGELPVAVVTAPPAEPVEHTGSYAPWGWGLTLGGALASGAGAFLIALDGEVTCNDGRGRSECPNVYDTKVPGMIALGGGAAAIGVGITLLILDPGGVPVTPETTVQPTAGGAIFNWGRAF